MQYGAKSQIKGANIKWKKKLYTIVWHFSKSLLPYKRVCSPIYIWIAIYSRLSPLYHPALFNGVGLLECLQLIAPKLHIILLFMAYINSSWQSFITKLRDHDRKWVSKCAREKMEKNSRTESEIKTYIPGARKVKLDGENEDHVFFLLQSSLNRNTIKAVWKSIADLIWVSYN